MNLTKLFEMQKVLDQDIIRNHPIVEGEDRLSKKILALLVELGECANEWRGFKFWSNDQEPRTRKEEVPYYAGIPIFSDAKVTNPLLEEYVDCLHFILSIGNDLGFDIKDFEENRWSFDEGVSIQRLFALTIFHASCIEYESSADFKLTELYETLNLLMILGEMLGFTEEQIEQAYYDKNKINFERQKSGY